MYNLTKGGKMKKEIIKGFLHGLLRIVYRVKITGTENIPQEGGCIIAANHIHALDPAVILLTNKRTVKYMAKEELFKNPILRWLAKIFDIFPVKRNGKDIEAIKTSLRILKRKEILGIFPEGTRHGLEKGKKVKTGAVLIAMKAGVPIIPAGISGTYRPFCKIELNYGKPIDYSRYKEEEQNKELAEKLTKELMDEIVRLRDITPKTRKD